VLAYLSKIRNPERRAQAAAELGVTYPAPVVTEVRPAKRRRGVKPAPEVVAPLAVLAHEEVLQLPGLPYPPSVNRIWRSTIRMTAEGPRLRVLLSQEGRAYRRQIMDLVSRHGCVPLAQELAVFVHIYPPDWRRRDADNIAKALNDALTHAGIWRDDSQIGELHLYRHPPQPKAGRVDVIIRARQDLAPPVLNPGDELVLDKCQRGLH
jgi:crossover junction endodeoxyribonuclease RusA